MQIDKLFRAGVEFDDLAKIRSLQKELAKLTATEKLRESVKQSLEETKTPDEKRLERLQEIDRWAAKGALTIDQHARLVKHAREEFAKPFTIGKFDDGVEATTFGTAEMIRAFAARREQLQREHREADREAERHRKLKQPPLRVITMKLDPVPPFDAPQMVKARREAERIPVMKPPPKREITMMLDVVPAFENGKETKDAETHRLLNETVAALNESVSVLKETRDKLPALTGSGI